MSVEEDVKNAMAAIAAVVQANEGELFVDLGGMCVCARHLGMAGQSALCRRPKAKTFTTSMTKWVRVNEADRAWWLEHFGHPMDCESCEYQEKRGLWGGEFDKKEEHDG